MPKPLVLNPDRCLPLAEPARALARRLYRSVAALPIISPHGHTDPRWFADNEAFEDATSVLLWPDHYVLRMLYSQGVPLEALGIAPGGAGDPAADRRAAWRVFASHYHLFRGTPSRLWLDHVFSTVFGLEWRLDAETADLYYDRIGEALAQPAFRPRALFERFGIELLATTEGALDELPHHRRLREQWHGRVISTFRPDDVTDPGHPRFRDHLVRLGELTGEDVSHWRGYLAALAARRAAFRAMGVTATDHGTPTARTADLSPSECRALFERVRSGRATADEAECFRAQMLTEMAAMSCEDGMTLQIHPGAWRNHNPRLFERFGPDKGADMPRATDYVAALKPLLDRFGNESRLKVILFTLDESSYSRELAPLAGHYPCLRLGPSWWFHDSPEGMLRFRRQVTETAGFYNTVGFNDDTRAFFSIPARHDLARRIDSHFLAELVCSGRLEEDEAFELAQDFVVRLPREAYGL